MNYSKDILSHLLDIYERRGCYAKEPKEIKSIQLDVAKEYPAYMNRYDNENYKDINVAIEKLITSGYVSASKDQTGRFSKVKLILESVEKCYAYLKRESILDGCIKMRHVLESVDVESEDTLKRIVADFTSCLDSFKKLPYDLGFDSMRTAEVLRVIAELLKLDHETYIRNFSTALFRDSKIFQREYRSVTERILFDYTESVVEKDKILGYYNLYENPTYVLIKGDACIRFKGSIINTLEIKDGIALSNGSLEGIQEIKINADRVVTVENLTTYHDCDEKDSVYIYLGGYHNSTKQLLLEKIYETNEDKEYFHEGDLDVYGFLILENLKAKTGIPFRPLNMDIVTIERFYKVGLYKPLTTQDEKTIKINMVGKLSHYTDVLNFMLLYSCKVEQESIKALELIEKK